MALRKATRRQLFDEYSARLFQARSEVALIVGALRPLRKEIQDINTLMQELKTRVRSYDEAVKRGDLSIFVYYRALMGLLEAEIKKIDLEEKMVDLEIALEIASARYYPFYYKRTSLKTHGKGRKGEE